MKKILCKIDKKTGDVTVTREGYGSSCMEHTKLEEGLGLDLSKMETTAEYHDTTNQQQEASE